MSTLFQSPAFQQFLTNISQFPTVIFTGLVMFVTLYWVVALFGLVDVDDGLGGDGVHHSHGHTLDGHHAHHAHHAHSGHGSHGGDADGDIGFFSSLLMRFGLQGVPLLIILTLFSLIDWVLSYLNMALLTQFFAKGTTLTLIATATLIPLAIVSLALTGLIVAPIRKRLAQTPTTSQNTLIGQLATVRTLTVDENHGEAMVSDGGAGLILKVRAFGETFQQGDSVILVEYLSDSNAYRVIGVKK